MSERKINLEKILQSKIDTVTLNGNPVYHKFQIINAMKEACKQLLELAAENATYDWNDHEDIIIDKQSILDTIKQIE